MSAAEADALRRAMPLSRLIAGGMDWADAHALHEQVVDGADWPLVAERLGDACAARGWFLGASACYRFGQSPLTDDNPEKRRLYRRAIDTFARSGVAEHVEVGPLACWLLLPARVPRPPVVIQFGGFDGGREEYYDNARHLLGRGVGCLLADLPGQGETRLFNGVHADEHVGEAISALVVHLVAGGHRVGVWGNSLGGYLAALAASLDERIEACCVNGGTARPAEVLDRFPRFIGKVQAFFGEPDPDRARARLEAMTLAPERIACPLLVVHGTPDQVFLIENARALYEGAASADKRFVEFADGEHCAYNHARERNALIAGWFATELAPTFPPLNVFAALGRHPALLQVMDALARFLLDSTRIGQREKEIVILRMAWRSGSEYEFGRHTIGGREAGLANVEIAALAGAEHEWSDADGLLVFAADQLAERAVLDPATHAAVEAGYGSEGALELLVLAGYYRLLAGVLNTLAVPLESGVTGWPTREGAVSL